MPMSLLARLSRRASLLGLPLRQACEPALMRTDVTSRALAQRLQLGLSWQAQVRAVPGYLATVLVS
jgi:hypothetical protein